MLLKKLNLNVALWHYSRCHAHPTHHLVLWESTEHLLLWIHVSSLERLHLIHWIVHLALHHGSLLHFLVLLVQSWILGPSHSGIHLLQVLLEIVVVDSVGNVLVVTVNLVDLCDWAFGSLSFGEKLVSSLGKSVFF
jgi:hypothetical protein